MFVHAMAVFVCLFVGQVILNIFRKQRDWEKVAERSWFQFIALMAFAITETYSEYFYG